MVSIIFVVFTGKKTGIEDELDSNEGWVKSFISFFESLFAILEMLRNNIIVLFDKTKNTEIMKKRQRKLRKQNAILKLLFGDEEDDEMEDDFNEGKVELEESFSVDLESNHSMDHSEALNFNNNRDNEAKFEKLKPSALLVSHDSVDEENSNSDGDDHTYTNSPEKKSIRKTLRKKSGEAYYVNLGDLQNWRTNDFGNDMILSSDSDTEEKDARTSAGAATTSALSVVAKSGGLTAGVVGGKVSILLEGGVPGSDAESDKSIDSEEAIASILKTFKSMKK
jgi:hypothetical protein